MFLAFFFLSGLSDTVSASHSETLCLFLSSHLQRLEKEKNDKSGDGGREEAGDQKREEKQKGM